MNSSVAVVATKPRQNTLFCLLKRIWIERTVSIFMAEVSLEFLCLDGRILEGFP